MTDDIFTRIAQRALGESTSTIVRPLIAPLYAPGAALPALADARLSLSTTSEHVEGITELSVTHDASGPISQPNLRPRGTQPTIPAAPILTTTHEPVPHRHAEGWPLEGRVAREAGVVVAEHVSREPVATAGDAVAQSSTPVEHDASASLQSAIVSPAEMVRPNIAPLAPEPLPRREHPEPVPAREGLAVPVDVRLRHAQPTQSGFDARPIGGGAHHAEPAALPPQVRVTIGRVEVRAITARQAPPAPQRLATPSPQMSLEDYLRGRNEGRR
jgi:hypothetical protein